MLFTQIDLLLLTATTEFDVLFSALKRRLETPRFNALFPDLVLPVSTLRRSDAISSGDMFLLICFRMDLDLSDLDFADLLHVFGGVVTIAFMGVMSLWFLSFCVLGWSWLR